MVHQRLDFALLSMDQLVNNAAKWRYMFGSQRSVPITIRLILGRGWGQGAHALAEFTGLVCSYSRSKGSDTFDAGGRQGFVARIDLRSQSGGFSRAPLVA